MYSHYCKYLSNINNENLSENDLIHIIPFKSDPNYNCILEHVNDYQGTYYLRLIEDEFPNIGENHIIHFTTINDKYGSPKKYSYVTKFNTNFECSATSLRYVYHALVILEHYKNVQSKNIVEVGCGYGGLFLSICYFSKLLNITIDHYSLVDLREPCNLINLYLKINSEHIHIPYSTYDSEKYGGDVLHNESLFFISNYCFTEIDEIHRIRYVNNCIQKTQHGFIIWQTCMGCPIERTYILTKDIIKMIHEKPQTSYISPNYFVYY